MEIAWLGRGGQGAVTATRILAAAALKEEINAQSLVFFTADRRGAPVYAFNRLSTETIREHHYPTTVDALVIIDPQLVSLEQVKSRLKKGGILILNYNDKLESLDEELCKLTGQIAKVDATSIAIEMNLSVAGIYITNVIMLGAVSKVIGYPKIDAIKETIKERWQGKIGELNAEGAMEGFEKTEILR